MTARSPTASIARFRVLDCSISGLNLARAVISVDQLVDDGEGGYVCFVNVHSCVTARHEPRLAKAINDAALAMPDGKPIARAGQKAGLEYVSRVGGPDFFEHYMQHGKSRRHFFLGSTEQTLALLIEQVQRRHPGINVVGGYSPPFGPFDDAVNARMIEETNTKRPDVVWLGLGAPKQEFWMADNWRHLKPAIVLGVGAAFDFHAGVLARAPNWVQQAGFEWLHRLAQEPRRLWKRYLVTNCQFLYYRAVGPWTKAGQQ